MDMDQTPPANNQATPVPPPQMPSSPQKNTGMALLSYIGILVVIPLVTAKDDPFVKFHIKQGLVLLITDIVVSVFSMVPIIGWFLSPLLWIGCLILAIIGIMNAVNGKEQELPVIGKFSSNFHF